MAKRTVTARRAAGSPAPRNLDVLQQSLGRRFDDVDLLAHALVHRSYLNEASLSAGDSNERMEFLGDAVIGFVIARELYRRFDTLAEGQLTQLRAMLVRWETLAAVANRLDLGAYLVLGKGEEHTGGRQRPMNLARALEAVVGAIAEDGTFRDAERFILRVMRPELDALKPNDNVRDIKSRLQEWAQARLAVTPGYQTVGVSGPDHARVYTVEVQVGDRVLGTGNGRNKLTAERAAATEALRQLHGDAD